MREQPGVDLMAVLRQVSRVCFMVAQMLQVNQSQVVQF